MTEEMRPCPFCGSEGRETRFDDTNTWTGMRAQHVCTTLLHFCTRADDDSFVNITIQIRGRDKADCIARWNAGMGDAETQSDAMTNNPVRRQLDRRAAQEQERET